MFALCSQVAAYMMPLNLKKGRKQQEECSECEKTTLCEATLRKLDTSSTPQLNECVLLIVHALAQGSPYFMRTTDAPKNINHHKQNKQ